MSSSPPPSTRSLSAFEKMISKRITKDKTSIMSNAGITPLKVPGFGLPIDHEINSEPWGDHQGRFRHGVNDFLADRMTVREVAMLRFMDAITDKPNWNVKVFDDEIVSKWRNEAIGVLDGLLSEKAVEWCVTELRDRAKDFERDGFIRTLESASRCVKSDGTIEKELQDELKKAVEPLLNVDDEQKDWHPNSNKQVLNLVHPSLYPFIYGKSRILTIGQVGLLDCMESRGKGEIAATDQEISKQRQGNQRMYIENKALWSNRFQWLPAEVKFQDESGTDIKITSYINNLHPVQHQSLYGVIEKFISKVIPLWNQVLLKTEGRASVRIRTYGAKCEPEALPEWIGSKEVRERTAEGIAQVKEYLALPDNPAYQLNRLASKFGDNWERVSSRWNLPDDWENTPSTWPTWRVVEWKYKRIRKVIHPEPSVSFSYDQWKAGHTARGVVSASRYALDGPALDSYTVKLEEQFRQQGLQIIVKLSSIELSPENPSYRGGHWHLEGMLNEHIVATAIYYYDADNVTPSRLRFRQEASLNDMNMQYEQGDHDPLSAVFGTESMTNEPGVQEIGSIATPAGRLLVFPNTLQHRVDPFQLLDDTKPGHRRFLVLWLVDPHYRIVSTANVPPQQMDWWSNDATAELNQRRPQELMKAVQKDAPEGQIPLNEAKELRLELMKERTVFGHTVEANFETYNLCEH